MSLVSLTYLITVYSKFMTEKSIDSSLAYFNLISNLGKLSRPILEIINDIVVCIVVNVILTIFK